MQKFVNLCLKPEYIYMKNIMKVHYTGYLKELTFCIASTKLVLVSILPSQALTWGGV